MNQENQMNLCCYTNVRLWLCATRNFNQRVMTSNFKSLYFLKWCSIFDTSSILKIQSFPLGMLIFRQKLLKVCNPRLKTQQSVLPNPTVNLQHHVTLNEPTHKKRDSVVQEWGRSCDVTENPHSCTTESPFLVVGPKYYYYYQNTIIEYQIYD